MTAPRGSRTASATMRDVAKRAEVSVQTVSNVVNGRVGLMTEQTRERVVRAMVALDYRPNVSARGLRSAMTRALGFLLLDDDPQFLADPMTDLILAGIGDVSRDEGYGLLIQSARPGLVGSGLLSPLEEKRVDGAIMYLSGEPDVRRTHIRRLIDRGYSFVLIGEARSATTAVTAGNYDGAYRLTAHLLDRGHKRIAFAAARTAWSMIDERYAGYRAALTDTRGEPPRELQLFRGRWDAESGQALAEELLALPDPPTAIMAANDLLALGVMRAVRQQGLRIPEDVAVTGFNDFAFSAFVEPALTTVSIPAYEMGRAAATMLIQELQGGERGTKRVFPVELIHRESS